MAQPAGEPWQDPRPLEFRTPAERDRDGDRRLAGCARPAAPPRAGNEKATSPTTTRLQARAPTSPTLKGKQGAASRPWARGSQVLFEGSVRPETHPFSDCSSIAIPPPPAMVSHRPASTKFSPETGAHSAPAELLLCSSQSKQKGREGQRRAFIGLSKHCSLKIQIF